MANKKTNRTLQADNSSLRIALAACEKRTKELDEREAELIVREALVDNGPLKIMILEETIRARKLQLKKLMTMIANSTDKLDKLNESYDIEYQKQQKELSNLHTQADKLDLKIAAAQTTLDDARIMKADINQELADRKKYQIEQERLIADAIEEGNLSLKSIQFQIEELERVRIDLTLDITALETTKTNSSYAAIEAEQHLENLKQQAIDVQTSMDKAAQQTQENMKKIGAENKRVTADTDEKLKQLALKEHEVAVKREAMRLESVKIAEERRRWESTKSLYDI